jgi:hypothetical protein
VATKNFEKFGEFIAIDSKAKYIGDIAGHR